MPPLTFLAPLVVLFNRLARKSSPSVCFATALLCAKQASAGCPDCQPSPHTRTNLAYIYHAGAVAKFDTCFARAKPACALITEPPTHPRPLRRAHTHTLETWHTRQCVINNFPLNYPCKFRLETNLHFTHGAPPGSLTASASCWGAPLAPPSFAHMQTCERVKGDELYVITRRECSLDEIRHYGSRCTLHTSIRCRSEIASSSRSQGLFIVIV